MSAYNAMSPALQARLGPPVDGKVLSNLELMKLKDPGSNIPGTVMCLW